MSLTPSEQKFITIIDYEITLKSGVKEAFTLQPDKGDLERRNKKHLIINRPSGHVVKILLSEIALECRREWRMKVAPQTYQSPSKTPQDDGRDFGISRDKPAR